MSMRCILPFILLTIVFLVSPCAVLGDPTIAFEDREKALKEALESKDPVVRARAFDGVHTCADVRCVELIVGSVRELGIELKRIRSEQEKIGKAYETQFSKKLKADRWFDGSNRSSKDLDRYNKQVGKIRRRMDRLCVMQRNLENDFTRTRALFDAAIQAMSKVLSNVPSSEFAGALRTLETWWRDSKDPDDKMRWLDVLAPLERPIVGNSIWEAVKHADMPVEIRAAALQTLGARGDVRAFDMAITYLEAEQPVWDMTVAAIQVLGMLHEKRCIEPLIRFLEREDLGRRREDVHAVLKALTGEIHGPFAEPWQRWWEDYKERFRMPDTAVVGGPKPVPGEGVTFYGVHTFSTRVLFVLDVSGSMDKVAETGGSSKITKIAVARKELIGAISGLNNGDRFNVIFFNHEVVPWQPRMVDLSNSTRRRARKWIESQEPQGGTNIHDALEAAFAIALKATGEPIVDTVFFLTDGRPTSGKILDPERILAEVADWNRTARLKIHTIGIGDHDQDFMKKLAKIGGGGTYVAK